MKVIDGEIWAEFLKFELTPGEFNGLEESEKKRYFNTIRYNLKQRISEIPGYGIEKKRIVFRLIDKRTWKILFD
ncbi:MAG: hypothetical protein JRI34_00935 [Deltaproteobacteria bacterium]|nr:hypothetical protein [Deltaproteobacteria bacterium]